MIPIYVDPPKASLRVIGRGPIAARRAAWLAELGAKPDLQPEQTLKLDFEPGQLVWIAGLDDGEAEVLAATARNAGALVNVEDRPHLCDFHTPAVVRRGRLTLAAGTGGASPAATRLVRERLEALFPGDWADALDEVATVRSELRARDASVDAVNVAARETLTRRGLI